MPRTHHAPARLEQPSQPLIDFLTNDVSIWLQAGSESLAELAELLRAIRKIAQNSCNPAISDLANLGIRVAEDYSNCVGCCVEELQRTYLDIALT
ncbi:hypothetical protein [Advenella sp. FME57]|uniref:hypothetical protein n=1 Tax=Advenella sp. FME57 TaxID=2742604 RepID=UPI00186601E4|nr:hypothetical protein [Advenella sp. FME57]